jgi:monoamine oxidase
MTSEVVQVVVVGAGAAGLTAASVLKKQGMSVRVLESDECIGGRMRKTTKWENVSIDIGGEWIHVDPSMVLPEIVDGCEKCDLIPIPATIPHDFGNLAVYDHEEEEFYYEKTESGDDFDAWKWVNSTWWDFFNDHVASSVRDDIVLGCVVRSIEYSSKPAIVTCQNGDIYRAEYVIVTVSMKVLQDGLIKFTPALPGKHLKVLDEFRMEPGMKVFIEFSDTFYPDVFEVEQDYDRYSLDMESASYGERVFYNEMFGKTKSAHILGIFAYGRATSPYMKLADNHDLLVDSILSELDSMFEGKASQLYRNKAIVQIWSATAEPYVRTGYTRWVRNDPYPIKVFQKPVAKSLLFAGEALPVDLENWGYVHGAALSGKEGTYNMRKKTFVALNLFHCFIGAHISLLFSPALQLPTKFWTYTPTTPGLVCVAYRISRRNYESAHDNFCALRIEGRVPTTRLHKGMFFYLFGMEYSLCYEFIMN